MPTPFYLDVSAVGNEYQVYNTGHVPTTWAVPEDGNGLAGPAHAAAVSIGTIDCASASASGAGQLLVLGTSVSSTLTGSGSTLATNIAAAINACATAVGSTYSQRLLPLNRLVYARVNPGTSTEVQIMLRIAGVDWNGMTHTTAGTWSPAPGMGAFAGGANGPMAYWWNSVAVFGYATGLSAPLYGMFVQANPGATVYNAATDPIYVRTKRSGVDLSVVQYNGGGNRLQCTVPARWFVFDDGTTWAGDNGRLSVTSYNTYNSGSGDVTFTGPTRWHARAKYGFSWKHSAPNNGSIRFVPPSGYATYLEWVNVQIEEDATTPGGFFSWTGSTNGYNKLMRGVRWRMFAGRVHDALGGNSSNPYGSRWVDCDFEYYVACPTPSGIIDFSSTHSSPQDGTIEYLSCRFTFVTNGPITNPTVGAGAQSSTRVLFHNCVGIKPGIMTGTTGDTYGNRSLTFIGCADVGSGTVARSFFTDTGLLQTSFIDNGTSPYVNATTPTGGNFAIKALLKQPRQAWTESTLTTLTTLFRDPDSTVTLTVEVLVATGVVITKSALAANIAFVDSAGAVNHVSTLEPSLLTLLGTANQLTLSGASWSGASGFVAYKLVFDTGSVGKLVKQGTEISCRLSFTGVTPGGADATIYIHPELVIS